MANETIRCSGCDYCQCIGRSNAQAGYIHGRKHYYCKNPDRDVVVYDFVGYGDNTKESKLKLKTTPKWCPRKKE